MPKVILILSALLLFAGCGESYTPKPYGYFRIDFPPKQWQRTNDSHTYSFQLSAYARG